MKRIPITKKLFYTYTILFVVFYILSASAAVIFMARDINRGIIDTQKQMAQTVSHSVEQYFDEMNDFSLKLMNSMDFKQAVIYDLPRAVKTGANQQEALQHVYDTAYDMFNKGYNVGVFTRGGVYIWMGDRILVEQLAAPVDTYSAYDGHGKPELILLTRNEFLDAIDEERTGMFEQTPAIALARSINITNRFANPQAMLEVQVRQSDFARFMEELTSTAKIDGLRVTVLDNEGQKLYGDSTLPEGFASDEEWMPVQGNMMQMHTILSGSIRVLYEIPSRVYFAKLTQFIAMALVFFAVLCVLLMFVTYHISKQISKPISQMCAQMEGIDLTEAVVLGKVDTKIYELDVMAQAITAMNEKLIATLSDVVVLETAEVQSRLMALQSQMQPHFLHNTLAAISSLSQSGETAAVADMCKNLSQMLRYVSEKRDEGVSLFEEVKFLRSYVDIMRARFPDAQLSMEIPMEMLDVRVPKLIIQPFVENSFKYAGRSDTKISVVGEVNGGMWRVRVTDNGAGFSAETVEDIMRRCHAVSRDSGALSAHIDGMGFVNIYTRLHLLYKDSMIFSISPGNGGVEIGGPVNVSAR